MNLLRLGPGQKRFWVITALALAAVAGMVGLNVLGLAAVRRDARLLAEVRRELARREEQQRDVRAAGRILARLGGERSLIEASFADPAEPLTFIEAIERLARRFGSRAELRLIGDESRADSYEIAVEGPFPGVLAFFQRLESLPYLLEINGVDLARGRAAGAGARPEASLRLVADVRLVLAPAGR